MEERKRRNFMDFLEEMADERIVLRMLGYIEDDLFDDYVIIEEVFEMSDNNALIGVSKASTDGDLRIYYVRLSDVFFIWEESAQE